MIISSKQKGFTLIELLVVISIIGLLSSVVLASLSTARDKGRIAAGQKFYSHNSHALAIDAVAYWSFDEGAGSTVADSWGSNNNGIIKDTSGNIVANPAWTNGMYRKSLDFTSNIHMDVTASTSFDPTDELTIMAWVNTSTTVGQQQIITEYTFYQSLSDKFVRIQNGGKLCLLANAGAQGETCSLASINSGKWHHVAVTAKEGQLPNFYIDGQLRNDPANVGNANKLYTKVGKHSGEKITVGANPTNAAMTAWTDYFKGSIDELGVYSKSFSLAQIQEYYAMTAPKYGIAMNK